MKNFEKIALIILIIIAIICIPIFLYQLFTSDTDIPLANTLNSNTSETPDNSFDITENIISTNESFTNNNSVLDITILDITVYDDTTTPSDEYSNIIDESISNDTENVDTIETSGATISFVTPEVSDFPYYIKVNVATNTITVYSKDSNNSYSIPEKAFICSTGTATPHSGVYATPKKFEWVDLFGNCYGQYSTQIVGNILFHSVPYNTKYDKGSLRYTYYDKLGTSASAGCVRLTVADAKWLYDNCPIGTKVEFYNDISNPGPLGKPTAKKISNNYTYRNWDPTDPDPANPWRNEKNT